MTHPHTTSRPPAAVGGRRAFTLLELLVVVGIIAILAAILIGVAPGVLSGQKAAATRATLLSLDRALDEYMSANAGIAPPFRLADYEGAPGRHLQVGDDEGLKEATAQTGNENRGFSTFQVNGIDQIFPRFPDASVFIRAALGSSPQIDSIFAEMPPSILQPTVVPDDPQTTAVNESDRTPSVLDGWGPRSRPWEPEPASFPDYVLFDGMPILYIHPDNVVAQRLYGRCVSGRPYFMSAGADRIYGATNQYAVPTDPTQGGARTPGPANANVDRAIAALKDNLYSYQPEPADIVPGSSFNTNNR